MRDPARRRRGAGGDGVSDAIETAHAALSDAITAYCRTSGKGNELVTGWLLTVASIASDIDDGETAILVTMPRGQGYVTNLGLAVHTSRYFGPGDD